MNTIVADLHVPFKPRGVMHTRRILRAYLVEAKFEILRILRKPSIAIPFLLVPAPSYVLFAMLFARKAVHANPLLANYVFESCAVLGMIVPALFGAGITLAVDREGGLLKLKRALPMPPAAYLIAKMATALLFATLVMISLVIAALWVGSVSLAPGQMLALAAINIVGALPFCAIGLFIGSRASASSAPAFANFAFLPMMALSGLFFPLTGLAQLQAPIWPAFHLSHLALAAVGQPGMGASVLPNVVFLVGVTLAFGGLAIRRLARVG